MGDYVYCSGEFVFTSEFKQHEEELTKLLSEVFYFVEDYIEEEYDGTYRLSVTENIEYNYLNMIDLYKIITPYLKCAFLEFFINFDYGGIVLHQYNDNTWNEYTGLIDYRIDEEQMIQREIQKGE